MAKLVVPKNELKAKVGEGGFDEKKIAQAQEELDNTDIDFRPIATALLAELETQIGQVHSAADDEKPKYLSHILDPLLQIKSQGAMFHYPSASSLSHVLVDFLDSEATVNSAICEIIVSYHSAASALIKLGIKDENDKNFQSLLKELSLACERYQKKKAQ